MKTKKNFYWCFLLTMVCLLCGCSREEPDENEYTLFYVNTEGTKLIEAGYTPAAENFDEMMTELIGQLTNPQTGYVSALRGKTKITGYERGIDALRIDFTPEYYQLTNVEEVLLRAAIVKTFVQIPGVSNVMITVNKNQLMSADGVPVPAMNGDAFIETKEGGINSYLYATVNLYFSDLDGDLLILEPRNLHYSSNMILERVVVEQLINGPESENLRHVLDSSTKIISIYVKNGICTINLSEEANLLSGDLYVDPEIALYAIVNSICATSESVTGVKIEIEGESDGMFRDVIDLNQVFMINNRLIKDENNLDEHKAAVSQNDPEITGIEPANNYEQEESTENETELVDTLMDQPLVG